MKKNFLNHSLCAALLLSGVWANAREEMNKPHKSGKASFKTEAGDCVTPSAQFDLDINNVRARLLTGGDAWWNLSEARYEVPKGDGSGTTLNAIFAGAIWITGLDAGGNLKCAAQRYRQGGDDFWPGPLTNGVVDKATCNKYDRFFNVYGADIAIAQDAYMQKGTATTVADIPKAVLAWPGKGNPYLQTDPSLIGETFDVVDNLAPFFDADDDGIYDPVKGDYPVIPCRGKISEAFADQMVFYVFNDMGNQHTESSGQSIGIQVNTLAFAFQTTDEINNMTFYKYEIINKSANPLFQTYISQWADPDLGCYSNDRVGCDTTRDLGIVYNDGNDPDCNGVGGYGSQLPLIGIDFFEGPLGDDSPRTQLGLNSFVYFTNGAPTARTDPGSAAQYRNYMTGFWADGTPFTDAPDGYGAGNLTNYIFSGEPCNAGGWSDYTSGQPSGDRRFVQTSGPFTLRTGEPQYVTIGVVFVRPPGGVGSPPCFATTIGPADDKAQLLFNSCFKLLDGPDAPTLAIREMDKQLIINFQNQTGNNVGEKYNDMYAAALQYFNQVGGGVDTTYTFEGYKLYQVANPKVSATDLDDPTKALLYAQVDVKNGVSRIINYEKDAVLGLIIPVMKVDGSDAGITNSFKITQDLFATGASNALVNHRTYYYTAVAYAYNNYLPYDQANPQPGTQVTPYLQGRGNFKIYSAIPHISDPRNEGTVLNAEWGEGVEVKRIEGTGNGGNLINLTTEVIEQIVKSGSYAFADTLTYVKGNDPIGFKVTDPVSLKEADFELQFVDTGSNVGNGVNSKTAWVLRDLTNQETIKSDRTVDRPYEQQIFLNKNGEKINYGFSLKLGTPAPVRTIAGSYLATPTSPNRYAYPPLPSTIEYENPVEQWLSFVKDDGVNAVTNWIRSGTVLNSGASNASPASRAGAESFDDNWYYTSPSPPTSAFGNTDTKMTDSTEAFEKIANGTWAPYCLTSNYSKKNLNNDEKGVGKPPFVYQPGFKWFNYGKQYPPQNTLDRLASVDVIITPDVTKWSRCVVFETGEDEALTEGADIATNAKGARKGQIRMKFSRNWNNPNTRDYLVEDQTDIGRSWFPGYAVNIETGERLNIAFGESSDMADQNGADMLWNPTTEVFSPVSFPNQVIDRLPYFGGKHFIYVMGSKYDECAVAQQLLLDNYAGIGGSPQFTIPAALRPVYQDLMWTSIPHLTPGYSFAADGNGNKIVPPAEVKVKLRVEKPFNIFATNASGDSMPRYHFSTKGMGTTEKNKEVAKSALDIIRVVPNPYLAYSEYETDQNTNKVKITNLPNKCTITIYSLDGTLIRRLSRAIDVDPSTNKRIEISDGNPVSDVNLDNTVEWDLKNDKGIAISSGIYLFQVEAPGIGQRTLKWFGAVRPADTSNF